MRRTVFLTSQVPWPLDVGYRIRVFNLLRSYADLGPVTLVTFSYGDDDAKAAEALGSAVESVHFVPFVDQVSSYGPGKVAALRHAVQPLPIVIRRYRNSHVASKVSALIDDGEYDILHVERLFMAQNVAPDAYDRAAVRGMTRVLDIDDLESAKVRRSAALKSWTDSEKYLLRLEYLKFARYERRMLRSFDRALVCSEADRAVVRLVAGPTNVQVFRNGANLDACAAPAADDGATLVFLGGMSYEPNVDAVLYFAEQVLPAVRREVPGARLVIAGQGPPPKIQGLHNGTDVLVTGYVESTKQLFASATMVIVPIRIGGGTRIKILEAMAAGRPVVSTTIGCEGIDATAGVDIAIGDTPAEFARQCIDLLRSAPRRTAIGEAGRSLVAKKYRWEQIRGEFVSSLSGR